MKNYFQYNLLPAILFSAFSLKSIAANTKPHLFSVDTTGLSSKDYKLNKKQFLELYGKDDSSRALIDYFFSKRSKKKREIFVPLTIFGVATTASVIGVTSNGSKATTAYPLLFTLSVLLVTSLVFASIGIAGLTKYSKKNLWKLIQEYHAGHSIPNRIRMNPDFQKLVEQNIKEKQG